MVKFITIYIFSLLAHPVHVSMSSMEYVPEKDGYDITVRMYSDDLLVDLMSIYEIPLEYTEKHVYTGPEELYQDYINEKLKFTLDDELKEAKLLEVEKLEIETILRYFVESTEIPDKLNVSNTILTDVYMDQVNLFIYKDLRNELAFRFDVNYSNESINLKEDGVLKTE